MTDEEVVRRYLELSTAGDDDGAAQFEAPGIRFWVSGRLAASGDRTKEQHHRISAGAIRAFPDGYRLHIRSVVAHGDRVAVEAQGDGVLADGTRYTPAYAMFFEVEDGRITSMREYVDTEYIADTFQVPVRT